MSKSKHTTHFDDCGCRSDRYEAVIKDLLEAAKRTISTLKNIPAPGAWSEFVSEDCAGLKKAIQKAQELQPRGEHGNQG